MHGRDSLTASQDKLRTVPSGPTATPVISRVTASPQRPAVEHVFKDAPASLEPDVCE